MFQIVAQNRGDLKTIGIYAGIIRPYIGTNTKNKPSEKYNLIEIQKAIQLTLLLKGIRHHMCHLSLLVDIPM